MKLNELDAFLKERLAINDFPFDVSLNGVQVACSDKEIRKIGFAVDASLATIKAAAEQECDMLFVHHGLFWGKPLAVSGPHYERIRTLIGSDTALYACHLPLDAHPVYGNNAQMAMALGMREYDMFGMYHGSTIGVKGNLPFEMSLEEVCGLLGFSENTGLRILPFGKEKVKSVGIISAGHDADCGQDLNHLCIGSPALSIRLSHGVHLQSARPSVVRLTPSIGDEGCRLTKEKKKISKELRPPR